MFSESMHGQFIEELNVDSYSADSNGRLVPNSGDLIHPVPMQPRDDTKMNVWYISTLFAYPSLGEYDGWGPLSVLLKDEHEVWVDNDSKNYPELLTHEWGHNLGLWDRYGRGTSGKDYLMGEYPARDQLFLRSKDILDARQNAHDLREELGLDQ